MPSSFTQNLSLEKPATGEQAGTWGDTANNNYDVIDTAIDGNVSVQMPDPPDNDVTHPSILSTTQGQGATELPYGLHKVVIYTGQLGATGYVQIQPGGAQRIYMVTNQVGDSAGGGANRSLIFQQGDNNPGQTFTLQSGYSSILYADGAGGTANVYGVIDNPQFNNVLITGNLQVNGVFSQGGTGSSISIDQATGNVTIGGTGNQGSRLAVLGADPSVTVLGARAVAGQAAPVFLVQNSAGANLALVDPNGQLRAISFYAPVYTTGGSPGQFVGVPAYTLPVGGVTLTFVSGLLVGVA